MQGTLDFVDPSVLLSSQIGYWDSIFTASIGAFQVAVVCYGGYGSMVERLLVM